jgi:RimJ/RimL family protein N-acetyltransferase
MREPGGFEKGDVAGPRLVTARMTLVAATPALARAELHDRARFAQLLGVQPPHSWPPPLNDRESIAWTLEMLEADPGNVGWGPWYFLASPEDGGPRMVMGNGGFKGQPGTDGTVEVGYSILETWQRRGYAPEAVRALVDWAFDHPAVQRVLAQTLPEMRPSIRVLDKTGFLFVGPGFEEGAILFERLRGG